MGGRSGFRKLGSRAMLIARRSVALLAAYVVALQLLLLPLGVAAGAALPGVHCTTDQPGQPQTQGCPCTAGCGTACCQQTLAGSPVGPTIERASFVLAGPLPFTLQ